MSKSISIDTKTLIRFWLVIIGFILVGLFVCFAWTGLLVVLLAGFLAVAIRPLAKRIDSLFIKKNKVNKGKISSVLAFLIVMVALIIIVAVILPVVVSETGTFIGDLPEMFEKNLGGWNKINDIGEKLMVGNIQEKVSPIISDFGAKIVNNLGPTVISGVGSALGVLGAVGLTIILTLFFLLEGPELYDKFWKKIEGKKIDDSVEESRRILSRMMNVVSVFVSNQVVVALIDGASSTIVVLILSFIFNFSPLLCIPMGLITMVFYLIPMFGQIIGCVLVSLILLFSNPFAGIIFAIFYIIYAQIENNGIAPKIQGDSLSLSPLIVLIAVTIGVYFGGLIGAIFAIPVAGCLKVLIEEWPVLKEIKEKREKRELKGKIK